jgi:hypothetical protein
VDKLVLRSAEFQQLEKFLKGFEGKDSPGFGVAEREEARRLAGLLDITDDEKKLISKAIDKLKGGEFAPQQKGDLPDQNDYDAVEKYMKEQPMTNKKELKSGGNMGFLAALMGGGGHSSGAYTVKIGGMKGVWKPSDEENNAYRVGIPKGKLYMREVAAWNIARAIGGRLTQLVQPVVERTMNGTKGALIRWVDNAKDAADVGGKKAFDGVKDRGLVAAFDYLTGQTDRHNGNWMMVGDPDDANTLEYRLIDHGLMLSNSLVKNGMKDFRSKPAWYAKDHDESVPKEVAQWDEDKIVDAMKKAGLSGQAIINTRRRLSQLKERAGDYISTLPYIENRAEYGGKW